MKKYVLECSVDSVESALAAARGGADRLELCGTAIVGGVTPSPCLFEEIRARNNICMHVLIRPRFGDFCYTEAEVRIMCREIRMFGRLGAEGVVIGALCPDGNLDMEAMKQMADAAGDMKLVLHRAFDVARDPFEVLDRAAELGITTILTSGQAVDCMTGKELLGRLKAYAGDRIDIMAGAGIQAEVIRILAPETGITTYHMSGKEVLQSSMEYRKEGVPMGLPSFSEFEIWRTSEEKVRRAKEVLDGFASA